MAPHHGAGCGRLANCLVHCTMWPCWDMKHEWPQGNETQLSLGNAGTQQEGMGMPAPPSGSLGPSCHAKPALPGGAGT